MKKRLFMFATAALMLAACSNDGEVAVNDGAQLQSGSGVVAFDTYTSSATKAGETGVQTTATLQLTDKGFGVFSTYSNGAVYDPTSATPNFMYNQQVKYATGAWTYSPLKYWPNETLHDSQSPDAATGGSGYADNLSFFAYAPYVSAASGTEGITAMTGNTTAGNPKITYAVATDPTQSVDLLWGVAPAGGLRYTAVDGTNINILQGMPLINLIKPDKDQKIKFLFQHALARIGMTVVAAVDQIAPGGTIADGTKIFVNSVTLTDADDATPFTIPSSGKLNLNNTSAGVALWEVAESDRSTRFTATIDGTKLNADLQSTSGAGVTTSEKKVIAKDAESKDQYLMLIPTPGIAADFNVTINYDVVTTDAALDGGKSTVNNVITKKITLNAVNTFDPTVTGFVNNRAYNLKLILGLTSVKLEAEVADWQVDGSTEVYLPQNAAN